METIQAQLRHKEEGNSNRVLRRTGFIPAVLYGPEVGNRSIKLKERDIEQALRNQATNKPFKLNINGNEYDVMVYEVQRHPVAGALLHIDFKQINMNERIHTSIPVTMTGDPELGVASLVRHSIEITCLAKDIPTSFSVNVDGLTIGDVILVKDLDIPPTIDVELDELEVVVSVLPVKAKSDEEVEAQEEAKAVAEHAESPVSEAEKV